MHRLIFLALALWPAFIGPAQGRPAAAENSLTLLKKYLQALSSSSSHQGDINLSSRTLEIRGTGGSQRFTCRNGEYDVITASSGLLQTPVENNKYPDDLECGWTVTVAPGKAIRLEWLIFKVEDDSSCSYDVVDVFDGPDVNSRPLGAFCGTTPPPTLTSSSNHVTVRFISDDSVRKRGIRVRFTEVDGGQADNGGGAPVPEPTCGGSALTLTTPEGDLYTPGYSRGALTANCEAGWVIQVPSGQVRLTFPSFSLADDDDCWSDQLTVYDGPGLDSPPLGTYCGNQAPPVITASGNALFLYLLTSDESGDPGFHAHYTTINAAPPTAAPAPTTTTTTPAPTASGGCGSHVDLSGQSGTIEFPGQGLSEYPNNCIRSWTIQVPNGLAQLHFERLYIEPDTSCAYDWLQVYDGSGSGAPLIAKLCGTAAPPDITATGSQLYLKFSSDDSVGGTGFRLTYGVCQTCAPTAPPPAPPTPQQDEPAIGTGFNCTFDENTCGWTQDGDDDFDWVRHAQTTPTDQTGPDNDHTKGNSQGSYMYVESSSPRQAGDVARLESPLLPPTDGGCLTFWYSMHGTGMGALRVLLAPTGISAEVVWEKTGDRGEGWIMGKVSVASATNYRLIFEGTTTGSIYGDLAIDDVSLSPQACSPVASHCGRSLFSKRVVGGAVSQRHQWPWAVFIKTYSADGAAHVRCGGTLIADRWVLTAAHCLEIGTVRITDPSKVKLHLGEHNVEQDEASDDYMVSADRVLVHPQRASFGPGPNDVALVRLSRPIVRSQTVNVACLPAASDSFPPGTACTAAGWGLTGNGLASSEVLLHVNMSIVMKATCRNVFGANLVTDDVICAGHDTLEKTSCRGDSGGPLVTRQGGASTLIGVVSWGAPCGKTGGGVPSAYASVQYFLSWIETTIGDNS